MAGFKDLTVAFVTPGVILDPSLLRGASIALPPEGIALGGTLILGGRDIASIGGYAGPDGIKIGGRISPFDVGPLHLDRAVVDFQTAIGAKPHFLLQGHAKLLSADVDLDVKIDEGGFTFHTKDKFGEGVEVELTARSTNGFSLKNNDFAVHAELHADIGRHLLEGLRRALEALFADLEADEKDAKVKLAAANATLASREKALAAMRAQVQRERTQFVHNVDTIRNSLADLDRHVRSLQREIDHALAAWQVELAAAHAAFRATDALLKAVERGVADLPLDADPRVLADLVSWEAARVHAALLDLEVRVLDLVVRDLKGAAQRLTDASLIDIHRIVLDGTFGTQLTFTVDAKLLGKYEVKAVGAFSPKDAASKATGLLAAAKDLASHLLSHKRTEHEEANKLPAPTGATPPPAAPGTPAPTAPATAGGELAANTLVGVGAGDMEGAIYEIRKGH
jgi:hypothetical protein